MNCGSAKPCLPCACKLCEASYPSPEGLCKHLRCVHGGEQRAREAWLCMEGERPHVVTPEEKRRVVTNFSSRYQCATLHGRHELPSPEAPPATNAHARFWCSLYRACAGRSDAGVEALPHIAAWETSLSTGGKACRAPAPERRQYVACAFCAMQYWNDELTRNTLLAPTPS